MTSSQPAFPSLEKENICPADEDLCAATIDDEEAVLDIDQNIYRGQDYLRTAYESHVTGPGITGYLYKKQGKVVGFLSAHLIDGGQTLLTCAGRIKAEYRGGGMYGRFTRRVFQEYRKHPDLRHVVMTVNDYNMAATGQRLLRTYRIIMEKVITNVCLTTAEMKEKITIQTTDVPGASQMSRDQVDSLLNRDPGQLTHLFPEGRIILAWKPYRVMAANSSLILSDAEYSNRIFVASSRHTLTDGVINSHDESEVSNGIGSQNEAESPTETTLSCGSYFFCDLGVRYSIDIFGSGSEEELRAHIEWHLLRLVNTVDAPEALVHVYYKRNLDDVVDKLKESYPLRSSEWPTKKVTLIEAEHQRLV